MDTIRYEYNIRGWLNSINKGFVNAPGTNKNWFGQELSYDQGFSKDQFNGNIAGIKWRSNSNNIARAYGYDYDPASRLTVADFSELNGASWTNTATDFTVSNLTYDANGNIKTMDQKGMVSGKPETIDHLTYSYQNNSNKLQSVSDTSNTTNARLGDFINGNATGNDYAYDSSGNLIQDLNKKMAAVTYNYLNLPATISISGKGKITYQYDAAGNKLRKTVIDSTGAVPKTSITDYINGFIYQNDTLQFASHGEGRIRPVFKTGSPLTFTFDYFEKDHLGNIRLVLTEQQDLSSYMATMEPATVEKETALFSNIEETRAVKPAGYPDDKTTEKNTSVAKLNAKEGGKKIGPSLVLRVMAGDTIQMGVRAFYKSQGPVKGNNPAPVEDMIAGLVQAFGGTAATGAAHALQTNNNTPFSTVFYNNEYERLKQKDPDHNMLDRPRAYLNYVLFDDQFKLVDDNSGVRQVKNEPDQLQTMAVDKMVIKKSGFLYVYASNETPQDVYFDNLIVTAAAGPLLEETHYYPFGLTMAGISNNVLKGTRYPENRYKFNGIEKIGDLGLEDYDAKFRALDPQIGRWWQIDSKPNHSESPYVGMSNIPVSAVDPLGDTTEYFDAQGKFLHKSNDGLKNAVTVIPTNAQYYRQSRKCV